jgi:hypothetical protein
MDRGNSPTHDEASSCRRCTVFILLLVPFIYSRRSIFVFTLMNRVLNSSLPSFQLDIVFYSCCLVVFIALRRGIAMLRPYCNALCYANFAAARNVLVLLV